MQNDSSTPDTPPASAPAPAATPVAQAPIQPQTPAPAAPEPLPSPMVYDTSSLPDPDGGPHKIWLIIFIVLLVVAVAIAAWEFLPMPGSTAKLTPPVLNTKDAQGTMSQLGSTLDDVDANMTPIDPSLSDQQGNLSE